MDNEVLKTIRSRRSVRKFKDEQISDRELQAVLEAGTWAATGHGTQDPWIVAVQGKEQKALLARLNAAVMGVSSDPYYGAPTIVVVLASEGNPNADRDGSLVLGNMMLAAHSIGIGSCWINREDSIFAGEEGKALLREWGLPEGLKGVGALSLGYPAAPAREPKPRKEGYFRVIK